MATFQSGSLPQILSSGEPIPEAQLAYLEQRAINNFYDFVLARYREAKESDGLTKAELARRINRGQDQVSRWLTSPSNWTIGTVARLLVGIKNEEALLSSRSYLERLPLNRRAIDWFEDAEQGVEISETPVPHANAGQIAEFEIA